MKDISDADYTRAKTVCKDFEINNLDRYHDLYVQGGTLLLTVVFENFRNICLGKYEIHPALFLTAQGLAWQAALRRTKEKLDLLINIDMLLMVEKGIRCRIYHVIYRYAEANNNPRKIMIKIKNHDM